MFECDLDQACETHWCLQVIVGCTIWKTYRIVELMMCVLERNLVKGWFLLSP